MCQSCEGCQMCRVSFCPRCVLKNRKLRIKIPLICYKSKQRWNVYTYSSDLCLFCPFESLSYNYQSFVWWYYSLLYFLLFTLFFIMLTCFCVCFVDIACMAPTATHTHTHTHTHLPKPTRSLFSLLHVCFCCLEIVQMRCKIIFIVKIISLYA